MDLRQLRTFVTIAEQGTVSRASAELRVAQPALSRQLQDLEGELGIKLFDRIRRRLVLTNEGKLLLADCRGALNAVSFIRERAQLLRRPDAGVLNVAATPQTIDGVLSGFLARYQKERPNVHVTLIEAVGAELMATLHRGEAHLLITTAGAIETSDRAVETIWLPSLEFVAASGLGTELAPSRRMDIRRLGSRPLLLLNRSFAVRQAFDATCRIAEFKPNIRFESRTPHTLFGACGGGSGHSRRALRPANPSIQVADRYADISEQSASRGVRSRFRQTACPAAGGGRVQSRFGKLCEGGFSDLAAIRPSFEESQATACPASVADAATARHSGIGAQFVEDEILDEDRLLADEMRDRAGNLISFSRSRTLCGEYCRPNKGRTGLPAASIATGEEVR